MKINLDNTFQKAKSIRTKDYLIEFYYNGDQDFYYFAVKDLSKNLIRGNIKIVNGYNLYGLFFSSGENFNYANLENINSWSLVYEV